MTPISRSISRAKRASASAAGAPLTPSQPAKIEERLVDRQRLDQRRQLLHSLADVATDARVFRHVGRQDDRLRAEPQRAAGRHRRAHAEGARDVAAGGDDAAPPAAPDDHRLVDEIRTVALLDRRVEGVAIDVSDRQTGVCGDEPRRAAARAAARGGAFVVDLGEAVAAEARHGGGRRTAAQGDDSAAGPAELVAGAGHGGGVDSLRRGEGDEQRLVGGEMVEDGGEKSRRGRRLTQIVRPEARQGEKPGEPLRFGGEEAQRVDRDRLGALPACG